MSNNIKKVLLVGCGPMALAYHKVLKSLGTELIVVGRGEASAREFEQETGSKVIRGGLNHFSVESINKDEFKVIVAVGVEMLSGVTLQLMEKGFKHILVEKPGGLNISQLQEVANHATIAAAQVLIAYNRRFYTSVSRAKEKIKEDGGLLSFSFEFTEWSDSIQTLKKASGVKENWFLANSSHVVDLAFYLGGMPIEMQCYAKGELSWHKPAIFSGAGISKIGVPFSYQANWLSAGRWGIELLTAKRRLILRPMEELKEQKKNSVAIVELPLNDSLDKEYKPGLFLQTQYFLSGAYENFMDIHQQYQVTVSVYNRICPK